jgi:nucleoside-diphosphate-sugar epimerase
MKILIIGGTGLISTAITRELLKRSHAVTHYNRGKSEVRFEGTVKNIPGDRNDFAAFERQIAQADMFDCVIDMIGYTPPQAESAVRAFKGRVGQFIFCSTVDVYQKPANRYPILENEPRVLRNDYGGNKTQCENIFLDSHQRDDLNVTIIRPAMTYGEGGSVVELTGWGTKYIDRMRKGKPIIVHGDGSSLWGACHIDDAACAFAGAVENSATFGKAYHVTGEEWLTWDQYYRELAQAVGAPEPRFVHIPTDLLSLLAPEKMRVVVTNFQGNNIFDNSAAHNDLGFRYTIPWVEGARRTVEWLDAHNRIQNSDDDPFDDRVIAAWERLSGAMSKELTD